MTLHFQKMSPPTEIALTDLVEQPCAHEAGTCAPCPYCTCLVDFGGEHGRLREARCLKCGRYLALSWGAEALSVRVIR